MRQGERRQQRAAAVRTRRRPDVMLGQTRDRFCAEKGAALLCLTGSRPFIDKKSSNHTHLEVAISYSEAAAASVTAVSACRVAQRKEEIYTWYCSYGKAVVG